MIRVIIEKYSCVSPSVKIGFDDKMEDHDIRVVIREIEKAKRKLEMLLDEKERDSAK